MLFRGDAAYRELRSPATKVVFIYTTGGDAGWTDGWWEAREQGAVAAVRSVLKPAPVTLDVAKLNGHPIIRYTGPNNASYFLRLPDGNVKTGKGYPWTGYESLAQLRDGGRRITAVDKSTSYESWADLWQTLAAIVARERTQASGARAILNASDYDATCNPRDHIDHRTTGAAVRMFAADYDRVWFVGYDTKNRPVNLKRPAFTDKYSVFLAYSRAAYLASSLNGHATEMKYWEWQLWGPRSYSRSVKRGVLDGEKPACGDPTRTA